MECVDDDDDVEAKCVGKIVRDGGPEPDSPSRTFARHPANLPRGLRTSTSSDPSLQIRKCKKYEK